MGGTVAFQCILVLLFCGRSMEWHYKGHSSLDALLIDGLSSFKGRGRLGGLGCGCYVEGREKRETNAWKHLHPLTFLMLYFISYIPALWRPKIFDRFLKFGCHNQDGMCDMSDGADVLNKAVPLHVFQSLRTLRTLHQAVFCSWFIISLISDCS